MRFFDDAKRIWQTFVPRSGQAETVQGELLRCVEKLRDEAIRNGNANWDDGFELFLNYVEAHLLDSRVFSDDAVSSTRTTLLRLRNYEDPYLEDDLYDDLSDRVVEYFRFYGSQPNVKNLRLQR